jgi:hypothetical protein
MTGRQFRILLVHLLKKIAPCIQTQQSVVAFRTGAVSRVGGIKPRCVIAGALGIVAPGMPRSWPESRPPLPGSSPARLRTALGRVAAGEPVAIVREVFGGEDGLPDPQ